MICSLRALSDEQHAWLDYMSLLKMESGERTRLTHSSVQHLDKDLSLARGWNGVVAVKYGITSLF